MKKNEEVYMNYGIPLIETIYSLLESQNKKRKIKE